jgi:hypothetical protein
METTTKITSEYFSKRLVELCLRSGLGGFPKDALDQRILQKSAALVIGSAGEYSQAEVDAKLRLWLSEVCPIQKMDHVTVRRWLVDSGFLTRQPDGSHYQVPSDPVLGQFDAAVDQVDVRAVIQAAREAQERRKREFMEKRK